MTSECPGTHCSLTSRARVQIAIGAEETQGAALRERLRAAKEDAAAKASAYAAQVQLRLKSETDAAEVAESLLVADQTIDTLSAEVEESRARETQLEGDLAVAKQAAAEQGQAVRRHAAALEHAAALRLEDGYAPGSAPHDLAAG